MTDYLALALSQEGDGEEKEKLAAALELPPEPPYAQTVPPEGAESPPGDPLMPKTPPEPQESPGEESFDYPSGYELALSGKPLSPSRSPSPWPSALTDQGRGTAAPLALELSPGRSTEGEKARFPHSVAGAGHGGGEPETLSGPAANLATLNTAGASQPAAVFDGLLPGSGSGAGGAILTSLMSRKRKEQEGFLKGAGGPFFGLSRNGPPRETALPPEGEFSPAPGREIPSAREEAVLPLLRQMRQTQWGAGFVQGQRRQFAVTLPEGEAVPGWSAEDFDLACERDARRYGGGFGLY